MLFTLKEEKLWDAILFLAGSMLFLGYLSFAFSTTALFAVASSWIVLFIVCALVALFIRRIRSITRTYGAATRSGKQ